MLHIASSRLQHMHQYWCAANYLTIGQIYCQENPLLREPLPPEHLTSRLLGHWRTSPGFSFIYVHLHRCAHGSTTALCVPPGRPADGVLPGTAGQAPDLHPRALRGHAGSA